MKLLIKICYVGTDYCGYQVQPNGVSIQQKLNEATKALFGFDCDIVGCSRTDCGVHANEFFATVTNQGKDELTTSLSEEKIPLALCAHLPHDIRVLSAQFVPSEFHPRYGVVKKEYLYRIWNSPIMNPFEENRACHLPKRISDEGFEMMKKAAELFVGTHDFRGLSSAEDCVEDTVRTVFSVQLKKSDNLLEFFVEGNGFLYHMVRILVGTLVEVGYGRKTVQEVQKALDGDRTFAGFVMPACGLYLNHVEY